MKPGIAYAFFRYDGSRKDIEEALPLARSSVAPSTLELSLYEHNAIPPESTFARALQSDANLRRNATRAFTSEGNNMVIEARLPEATSSDAAADLGTICNMLSVQLFPQQEREFSGSLVYSVGINDGYTTVYARDGQFGSL